MVMMLTMMILLIMLLVIFLDSHAGADSSPRVLVQACGMDTVVVVTAVCSAQDITLLPRLLLRKTLASRVGVSVKTTTFEL